MLASSGSITALTVVTVNNNEVTRSARYTKKELRQSMDQKISSEQMSAMTILVAVFGTTRMENPMNVDEVRRLRLANANGTNVMMSSGIHGKKKTQKSIDFRFVCFYSYNGCDEPKKSDL